MKILQWISKRSLCLIICVLSVLSVLCWPLALYNQKMGEERYWNLTETARELYEKGIYTDACECLRQADAEKPGQYDTLILLARCLRNLQNEEFLSVCRKASRLQPEAEEPYLLQIQWYQEKRQYALAYETMESATRHGCQSAKLDKLCKALEGQLLRQFIGADAVSDWHPGQEKTLAVFTLAEKEGLLSADGTVQLEAKYDALGMYDPKSGTLPCLLDGVWSFIDSRGNRKMLPDFSADSLGSFSAGLAPFQKDGKWGYLDKSMKVRLEGLEYAGALCEGVAAVRRDGKWALMDASLNNITPFSMEDIQLDSYGFCAAYSRCVLKQGGLWYLADLHGNILSEGMEAIRFPASPTEDIAFCKDGLWGFFDREGKITVSPQYAEAYSFCCGAAPVKIDGEWRYIRPNGEDFSDERYTEAGTFNPEGRAVVKKTGSAYLIVMSRYFEQ